MRKTIFLSVVLILAGAACFFLFTGSFFPKRIVEELNNPCQVKEITEKGFVMADGRLVRVPYVCRVPVNSVILCDAVKTGVEVCPDGSIFGLLRIHHWCGNDPVRYHIGRINLTNLILGSGVKADEDVPSYIIQVLPFSDKQYFVTHKDRHTVHIVGKCYFETQQQRDLYVQLTSKEFRAYLKEHNISFMYDPAG